MENNSIEYALDELKKITDELKDLKRIRSNVQNDIAAAKELLSDCTNSIEEINAVSNEMKQYAAEMKKYMSHMETINTAFNKSLDDAKQVETRLMMSKMEMLISKVESIGNVTNNQNHISRTNNKTEKNNQSTSNDKAAKSSSSNQTSKKS